MKMKVLLFIASIFFSLGNIKNAASRSKKRTPRIDTIEGVFFSEINVPYMCYTSFDAITQGKSILYGNDSLFNKDLVGLYKKGVFISNINVNDKFASRIDVNFFKNYSTLGKFAYPTAKFENETDPQIRKQLLYDQKGNLSYKKIYLKMTVFYLGKIKRLVPLMSSDVCTGTLTEIPTFFIKDFLIVKTEGF